MMFPSEICDPLMHTVRHCHIQRDAVTFKSHSSHIQRDAVTFKSHSMWCCRYVQEDILKPGDPNYRQFHRILESFKIPNAPEPSDLPVVGPLTVSQLVAQAAEKSKLLAAPQRPPSSDEEEEEEEGEKEEPKMSKKKLRKLNRLTVAQLKQLVERPDVVEMHDVTAMDPKLLIHLKVSSSLCC